VGDIGVAVAGAIGEIYRAREWAYDIERRPNPLEALFVSQDLFRRGWRRHQGSASAQVFNRDWLQRIPVVWARLIDGQVHRGTAQEGVLVHNVCRPAVSRQAQHGFIDEVLGILARAALAAKEFQEACES
jgi:hypothetical protein